MRWWQGFLGSEPGLPWLLSLPLLCLPRPLKSPLPLWSPWKFTLSVVPWGFEFGSEYVQVVGYGAWLTAAPAGRAKPSRPGVTPAVARSADDALFFTPLWSSE